MYAKPELNREQMLRIYLALQNGLDIGPYANEQFTYDQLDQISSGLRSGIEVSLYVKPELDALQMYELRTAIESEVNISCILDSNITAEHMCCLRHIVIGNEDFEYRGSYYWIDYHSDNENILRKDKIEYAVYDGKELKLV